jgi:hypothetical protein
MAGLITRVIAMLTVRALCLWVHLIRINIASSRYERAQYLISLELITPDYHGHQVRILPWGRRKNPHVHLY